MFKTTLYLSFSLVLSGYFFSSSSDVEALSLDLGYSSSRYEFQGNSGVYKNLLSGYRVGISDGLTDTISLSGSFERAVDQSGTELYSLEQTRKGLGILFSLGEVWWIGLDTQVSDQNIQYLESNYAINESADSQNWMISGGRDWFLNTWRFDLALSLAYGKTDYTVRYQSDLTNRPDFKPNLQAPYDQEPTFLDSESTINSNDAGISVGLSYVYFLSEAIDSTILVPSVQFSYNHSLNGEAITSSTDSGERSEISSSYSSSPKTHSSSISPSISLLADQWQMTVYHTRDLDGFGSEWGLSAGWTF